MYHIVFIHSSVDGHLGCFNLSAIVSAAVNTSLQAFFEHMFSILGVPLGVEFLSHIVILCLIYWVPTRLFPSGCTFYSTTRGIWGFQFFHILTNTCFCVSFLLQPP